MKRFIIYILFLLFTASLPLQAYALSSSSFKIKADAVTGGGGSIGSANYRISGLIGQPLVIGEAGTAGYNIHGGYYYIMLLQEILNKRATCLVFDAAVIYAGFDGDGVNKSTDNGATWTGATVQPQNGRIRGLVVKPGASATLYAATYGSGIFKSTDSASNWSACPNTSLGSLNTVSLAIDSTGKIYAGTEAGIFTSTDCNTWSDANSGLSVSADTPPVSIVIDPVTTSNIYAGLDGAGIYRSTNGGASWSAATTQPTDLNVNAIVIKPGDSAKLFAATYGGGVFTSTDSGANWSACVNTNLTNLNVISLSTDSTGKLYAGTEAGVFVSADSCDTWTAMSNGLP